MSLDLLETDLGQLQACTEAVAAIHGTFRPHTEAIDSAFAGVVGVCWRGDAADGALALWNTKMKAAIEGYANFMGEFSKILNALCSEELAAKRQYDAALGAANRAGLTVDVHGEATPPSNPGQQEAYQEFQRASQEAGVRALVARAGAIQRLELMHGTLSHGFDVHQTGDWAGVNSVVSALSGLIPLATKAGFGLGVGFGAAQTVLDTITAIQHGEDPLKSLLYYAGKDLGGALVASAVSIGVVALLTSSVVGAPLVLAIPAALPVADLAAHAVGNLLDEDWDYDRTRFGALGYPLGVGSCVWKAGGQVVEDGAGAVGWVWSTLQLPPFDLTSAVPDFTHLQIPTLNIGLPSISLPSVSLPSVSLPSVSLPSVSLPKLW